MEIVYYCPKCESENIETICLNPPEPKRISIDDIEEIGKVQYNDLVYHQYNYRMKCKDCGYSVNFSM